MLPVGFKPTIPASARPQTNALDSATTRIGVHSLICKVMGDIDFKIVSLGTKEGVKKRKLMPEINDISLFETRVEKLTVIK
jgi:hypothetical protein